MHKLGITDVAMITGDHQAAASAIAKELAIDEVYADALPADKLKLLSKLKPRPVVFVGDGVNDAPVLTSSDVGIALGAKGSTAASESADMVIMLDDLSRVAVAIEIAKKTFRIAEQSILVGIGLSLVLMAVFATGHFPPLLGAVLQEVVDVFVIFNALRAHIIKPSMVQQENSNN
jgi:P-type E1-E2 ATPase